MSERLLRALRSVDPYLAAFVLAGFALRLGWLLSSAVTPMAEAANYHQHAAELAAGEGFRNPLTGAPTAFLPPGYPALLAAVYVISGPSHLAAGVLNAVTGAAAVAVAGVLAWRLFGRSAGRWAAAGFALLPSQVIYTPAIQSDGLSALLAAAAALAAFGGPLRRGRIGATAVLTALAGLTSPQLLLLAPAFALGWALRGGWRAALGPAFALGLLTGLLLVPWAARSWAQLGEPVLLSSNGGVNLWVGNNPGANGGWIPWEQGRDDWGYPADEPATDRHYRDAALRYAAEHPLGTLRLWPEKFRATFEQDWLYLAHFSIYPRERPMPDWMEGTRLRTLTNRSYETLIVLALAGLALSSLRGGSGLLLLPAVAALVLPTFLFFGLDRFHVPLLPFAAVLAGGYLASVPAEIRRWVYLLPPRRWSSERLPDRG